MNNTISVIIPVYNVEKYIRKCINSVCNQSYKNLQIILIDDGSTDKSGVICDEYAKKDSRILVIHQKNKGAASAKNKGLNLATGEYLAFLDSDDYLEHEAYDFMLEQMKKFRADIVQCGFYKLFRDRREEKKNTIQCQELDAASYLKLYTEDWTCGLLWDKLYRRELYKGIFFEENHKIDDEFFTYRGVMRAQKIVRVQFIGYNYRQRKSGVMLSEDSQEKIVEDTLEYLSIRRKIVASKFPELKKVFDEHYLNMLLILSKKKNTTEESLKKIKRALENYNREKEKTKISFGLWKELKEFQYTPVKKLLKKRMSQEKVEDTTMYFD